MNWKTTVGIGNKFKERIGELAKSICQFRRCIDVLFIPHNKYHVWEMSLICPHLEKLGLRYLFVNIEKEFGDEGAKSKMDALGLKYISFHQKILAQFNPKILFVMNDWGPIGHEMVLKAKSLGIKTMGLVEGVQDYLDTHIEHLGVGTIRNPYKTVEIPLLIGDYDRKFFPEQKVFVVGSTRIEDLMHQEKKANTPKFPLVTINSNFTYGLYTSIQKTWLDGVVQACQDLNVNYIISQHHADKMDLSEYEKTDLSLYDAIRTSSVLVSRFSSAILECMGLKKPVIYHNPHGERMDTFQDPKGAYPITKDLKSLKIALKQILGNNYDPNKTSQFFYHHVSIEREHCCGQRIAKVIQNSFPIPHHQ